MKFLRAKVRLPPFRTTYPPGNDFYGYVNGRWLVETPMPKYSSSFGVSEEVESYIQGFLFKELYRCQAFAEKGRPVAAGDTYGAQSDAIGRLAMAALRESKQKHSIQSLKRGIRNIGCFRDRTDIFRTLGYLCRYGVDTLLSVSIFVKAGGDVTQSSDYIISLEPGKVGLPDASYYKGLGPGKTIVLYAYTDLIQKSTAKMDIDDLAQIIPFEAQMASEIAAAKAEMEKGDSSIYSLRDLKRAFPGFYWEHFFQALGIPPKAYESREIEISSVSWIKHLMEQTQTVPLENWASLFSLHTLLHALPYLPPPFDDWHFSFFEKLLRGQRKKMPQDILTLNIVKSKLHTALGYLFVRQYLSPEFKRQATQFAEKFLAAAKRRIQANDWLSAETKKRAAEKVGRMKISAAYSEPLLANPPELPILATENLLVSIYMLEAAQLDRQIAWLQRDAPKGLWDEPPYTVNAYYYHPTNEIVIPAGSYFWPFFNQDHAHWVGWNYGGLGAVIAHEITHAFDETGKEYSPSGSIDEWWSAEDTKAYRKKTEAIVRLFDKTKFMGRAVNGAATLSENIADLGGLAISLDALKEEIRDLGGEERKKQLRDFFVSYAVSWRTKEHPERKLQRLITDIHAPVELRVNLIVSQFDEWYDVFGIETGHDLYIPPEERVRIF